MVQQVVPIDVVKEGKGAGEGEQSAQDQTPGHRRESLDDVATAVYWNGVPMREKRKCCEIVALATWRRFCHLAANFAGFMMK